MRHPEGRMAVPQSVRKQEERADELLKAQHEEPEDTPEEEEGAPEEEEGNTTGLEQPESQEGEETAKVERLEQALSTLRGKYQAEVPRLSAELRSAKEENERLQQELEEARAKPKSADTPSIPEDSLKQLKEDYGEDFMEAVRLVAAQDRKADREYIERLEGRINEMAPVRDRLEQVEQTQHHTQQERFWTELNALVPDWEAVNQRQEFLDWLGGVDPLTGQQRQELLNSAHSKLDPIRVAAIFDAFKAQPSARQHNLESQVAPGKSKAAEPPASKPRYTVQDYEALMDEIRHGKWRGKEAEADAKEREIMAAITG